MRTQHYYSGQQWAFAGTTVLKLDALSRQYFDSQLKDRRPGTRRPPWPGSKFCSRTDSVFSDAQSKKPHPRSLEWGFAYN